MFPKGPPFFTLTLLLVSYEDDLEHERLMLKEKLSQVHEDLQILVEWQTTNLVLHGMFTIVHVLQTH